jgi:hypothetical protein
MEIKVLQDKILLQEKKDVLRWHLYGKFLQYNIKPFENDLDILLELYEFGGYDNAEEQSLFIERCLTKGLRKSSQSVRNTLSKYTKLKVLDKPKNKKIHLSDKFIPQVKCDKLVLQPLICHTN